MAEIQSTQDKYARAQKSSEPPKINDNEVRITTRGRVKKYVDYATRLFQGNDNEEYKNENATDADNNKDNSDQKPPKLPFDSIVLKATGKAINKAVTTAEVVKRTIGDLHQETTLETLEIVDVWEPREEGLQKVETTRRVASISIKLSRKVEDVDVKAPGYQKPIPKETAPINNRRFDVGGRRGGFRGRGRGFRGGGGGRGRGRFGGGPRGRGRGAPRGGGGGGGFGPPGPRNNFGFRGGRGGQGAPGGNFSYNRPQGGPPNQFNTFRGTRGFGSPNRRNPGRRGGPRRGGGNFPY